MYYEKLFFIAALVVAAAISNNAFESCQTIDTTLKFDIVSLAQPEY